MLRLYFTHPSSCLCIFYTNMIKVICIQPISSTQTSSPPIRINGKSVHQRRVKKVTPIPKPVDDYGPGTTDISGILTHEEAEILMETTARTVVENGGGCVEIATRLRLVGFAATVCISPTTYPYAISHTHVRVSHGNSFYAIDHKFRDQFSLSFGSPEYTRVMNTVPDIVVARLDLLIGTAGELTRLMTREFEICGMSIPPWRSPNPMLHRWAPNTSMITIHRPL